MSNVKDMTVGKPVGLMVRFSVPLIISNVLQVLFVVADSAIIGRMLGVGAFASIGAAASTHWLVFSIVLGLNNGFCILIAQRFGAKDEAGLHKAFSTALYFVVMFSVAIGAAGVIICRPLMELLRTPSDLIDGTVTYQSWLWAGMLFMFGNSFLNMVLFALGDSKTPLRAMVIATVVNIAFDFIMIIPFGIAGVAFATLIAQGTAMVYCGFALKKTGLFIGIKFVFDKRSAMPLLKLAIPLGFRNSVIEVGGLLVQVYVNDYGMEFVAGFAAAKRLYSLLLIVGMAIETTVSTFIAQNFGAGRFDRVRQGMKDGFKLSFGSAIVVMILMIPMSRQVLSIFIEGDPDTVLVVLDVGVRQLWLMAFGLPFLHLLFLYRAALQGLGNTFIPMMSGFAELVLRIVSVIFITQLLGDWGVLLSDPIGWPFAMALVMIAYFVVFNNVKKKVGEDK